MRRRKITLISYLLIVSIICGLFIIPTASHAKVWIYRECQFAEPGDVDLQSSPSNQEGILQDKRANDSNLFKLYSRLIINQLFGFIF